jgi:antitoxin HicB
MDYPVLITRISDADGGGYVGWVADLPGCMSDGDTPQEALANTISAIEEWKGEASRLGREIPGPGSAGKAHAANIASKFRAMEAAIARSEVIEDERQHIRRDLDELLERVDHSDGWTRFSALTGIGLAPATASKPKPR